MLADRARRQRRRRRHRQVAAALFVALVAVVAWSVLRPGSTPRAKAVPPPPVPSTITTTTTEVVSDSPRGQVAAWVVAENARPGTTGWALTRPSTHHEIEGYAGSVSVNSGQPVVLYVSTTAPAYHVEAYRMGWYGGTGSRLVWTSATQPGAVQSPFTLTPGLNTVETSWGPSLTVQTDATWPPGDYLFKLVASTGLQSYVPLTIRDDSSHAAYMVNNSVTTWQAYNLYGGYDLYGGGAHNSAAERARVVSFDRPYALGTGSGDFLGEEFHLVELVESQGLDVTYTTNLDVDQHPDLVRNHRAFLSLGHDEYYSLAMRAALTSARDQGVNLMFLGANAIYRHVRFEASPLGPDRHEIDYKSAAEDPLNGRNNADVTPVAWRSPPNNLPESELIGDYYQCNPVSADMVISDPSLWVWAQTGVRAGTHLIKVVGSEYDKFDPNAPGPRNLTVLARSPLVCRGQADHADMTYYTTASGAGVFATGTNQWIPLFNPVCALPCSGTTLIQVTENVLAAFGHGPAAAVHPSFANVPEPAQTTTATTAGASGAPGD